MLLLIYMEPQIIFEDDYILVIDKPSGMVVNKAETTKEGETVQEWAENKLKTQNPKLETNDASADFYNRGGIVHRLDKETSGLLLIAKTPEAFVNLQTQFKNRQVKKKYLALVHGKVIPEEGVINASVGRLPWNRERFGVLPGGREAVTRYKVLSIKYKGTEPMSLLEVSPETGRTHQIRIHLKYIGFPIVGDTFYAGRKQARDDRKFCPRVFLHAAGIKFSHPVTNKELEFLSPLPTDLEAVLQNIRL